MDSICLEKNPPDTILRPHAIRLEPRTEQFIAEVIENVEFTVAKKLRSLLGFNTVAGSFFANGSCDTYSINQQRSALHHFFKSATGHSIDSIIKNELEVADKDYIDDKTYFEDMIMETLVQELSHISVAGTIETALLRCYGVPKAKIDHRMAERYSLKSALQFQMQNMILEMELNGIFTEPKNNPHAETAQLFSFYKIKLQKYLKTIVQHTLLLALRKALKNMATHFVSD